MIEQRLVVTQGQQAVSKDPNVVFSTLLGSCVAVCLWDREAAVGGLNHILLANRKETDKRRDRIGTNAMEILINAVLKEGGERKNLTAKVFGGAQMVGGLSAIGEANAIFVLDYLKREGFEILGQSVGGTAARHVLFWPAKGLAKLKTISGPGPAEVFQTIPDSGNGPEFFKG